ncbi:VrrA/YqfQ family protein [Anaerobacillus sp. MEB173]|uniref:VrrA/YqfQ family protein n=1 Tax=Anaerobacillus sp. MEB173 TaxID=3383345 RepID=UPI003F90B71A
MFPTRPPIPVQSFHPGHYPFPSAGFPPMMPSAGHFPPQSGVPMQSGGLLSRLFGGAARTGVPAGFTGSAAPAGGMSNLLGMLQHAQRAFGVYQQVKPMIDQYGPIIRNVPTMYRALKAVNANTENNDSTSSSKKGTKEPSKRKRKKGTTKKTAARPKKRNNKPKSTPSPKLYV